MNQRMSRVKMVIILLFCFQSLIQCTEHSPILSPSPSPSLSQQPSPTLLPKRATPPKEIVLDVSYIPTCCSIILGDDLTSNEHLMGCVGRMTQLTRNYFLFKEPTESDSLISSSSEEKEEIIPPIVVVVSVLPSNVFQLHSSAIAINAAYTEHNKYLYFTMNQPAGNTKQKNIVSLLKDLPGTFYHGDLVFWLDQDVVVTDVTWRIEDIITPDDDDIDIFIVQDEMKEGMNPYQQNITCILYRNTGWSLQFFFMFDLYIHYHEEELLQRKKNYLAAYLSSLSPSDLKKVKILPSSMFHGTYPSHLSHQPQFPLLKLSGEDNMYVRSVFETGWRQICGHTQRHNLHPNPSPHPQSFTVLSPEPVWMTDPLTGIVTETTPEFDRDPLWSFVAVVVGEGGELLRQNTISDFSFSLPPQLGLNPKEMTRLHAAYIHKYFEIKNLVIRAKQLKADSGETPLPFRTINQIYRNTLSFSENQHHSIVTKSREDIIFLHLWCYANLRDAFLIPVMNIESDTIQSDINDLKAVVIGIFRTLFNVLFSTEKLLAGDDSRKSVRQHIVAEADKIMTPRIKDFFSESYLREGYYLAYKLLSLQPQVDKKRKAAEYWYYLFEMVPVNDIAEDDVAYTHADIDDWIEFFCSLGDILRGNSDSDTSVKSLVDSNSNSNSNHHSAAAVKYYGTAISLIRSMIIRREATLPSPTNSSYETAADSFPQPPDRATELSIATKSKLRMGRLKLGSALLGTVLCSNIPKDTFFTLESKQQLEQTKLTYLNESLEIFSSYDWLTFPMSKKVKRKYEAEYELANQTFDRLMVSLSRAEDDVTPVKKTFKRKKKKMKDYDMINPFV